MRIVVMGAGGVGGYFGGLLAKSGADVWFVARGTHLRVLREQGLVVRSRAGDFAAEVHATDDPADIGGADLVLFCVKTYDTEDALAALAPVVREPTIFLPLQNGVESADRIGLVFGAGKVLGGLAYIESFVAAPGVIEQRSDIRRIEFGELDGSDSKRARSILQVLRDAQIDAHLRGDIRKALWEKLAWIAPGGGMTAITRSPIGDVLAFPPTRDLFVRTIEEVDAVARSEGVAVDADLVDRTVRLAEGLNPTLKTSMLRDLERRSRLEVDALNGAVVRFGAKRSVPTPVNSFIHSILMLEDEKTRIRGEREGVQREAKDDE